MDQYSQLRDEFASHQLGAPQSDTFLNILRTLFTPEGAELATHMGFWPCPSSDIAAAGRLPRLGCPRGGGERPGGGVCPPPVSEPA